MSILDLIESPHLRVLSPERARALPITELQRLRRRGWIIPPFGAEDGDGDGGDGDGDGDGSGDGDDEDGDGDGDGSGDGSGDGDGGDDDQELPDGALSKAEADALKRKVAESEKKARDASRRLAAQQKKKDEEAGEYEKLYRDEVTKTEELQDRFKGSVLKRTVVEVAAKLNFRNPQLATRLLDLDASDVVDDDFEADESVVEKALKAAAKSDPYLVNRERGQADLTGAGDGNGTGRKKTGKRSGGDDEDTFGESTIRKAYAGTSS